MKANESQFLPQAYAEALEAMRELQPICEARPTSSAGVIASADRAYGAIGMLLAILRRSTGPTGRAA